MAESWVALALSVSSIHRVQCHASIETFVLDYMVHQYGSSEDYDKMAALTGDNGWSWSNMKNFIAGVSASLRPKGDLLILLSSTRRWFLL